ncbi:HTH-type transcriptional regulator SinR [Clostridioides difficile]|nr:HTH-type transcriptional regulator SinR [Clostridioides difficile]
MFKNNLKYYRKCKGMTQIQLARKAGITNDYISQIERGIKNPGLLMAKKISSILEENIEEVFLYSHRTICS